VLPSQEHPHEPKQPAPAPPSCRAQTPLIHFTRSRPFKKNDQGHIEQKNFTHVRLEFGFERYDHPAVWPRINALCRGPLHHLLNYCLPTMKLEKKERVGCRTVRQYGPACTPLAGCWPARRWRRRPGRGCGPSGRG
jgi:hypothetical protein